MLRGLFVLAGDERIKWKLTEGINQVSRVCLENRDYEGRVLDIAMCNGTVVVALDTRVVVQIDSVGARSLEFPGLGESDRITTVAAGDYHFIACSGQGKTYTWSTKNSGYSSGQLGLGRTFAQLTPALVPALADKKVVRVWGGDNSSYTLLDNGESWNFGSNCCNQLGYSVSSGIQSVPVSIGNDIGMIYANFGHHLLLRRRLKNGELSPDVEVAGFGSGGRLGTGDTSTVRTLTKLDGLQGIQIEDITIVGGNGTILLTKTGQVYSTGNLVGWIRPPRVFTKIPYFDDHPIIKIGGGKKFGALLGEDGSIYVTGETNLVKGKNVAEAVWKLRGTISSPRIVELKCGYSQIFFIERGGSILDDLERMFRDGIFTDDEVLGVKFHSIFVKKRLQTDDLRVVKDILRQHTKEDVSDVVEWIYTGRYGKRKGDVIAILEELGLPEGHILDNSSEESIRRDLYELFDDEDSMDFTVLVEDEGELIGIPCHKFILAGRSKYFRNIILESDSDSVRDYSGRSVESIEMLVKYFYTGTIEFTADDDPETIISELLNAKEFYSMSSESDFDKYIQSLDDKLKRGKLFK